VRSILSVASPGRAITGLPSSAVRSGSSGPEPAAWSGVIRIPAAIDPFDAVLTACEAGPTLVVMPSVNAVQVAAARLRHAGLAVAVMPDSWPQAMAGADVVIGARGAVWAPCRGLRTVVVVDEHDESLQEERNPTWHARDVAIERARRAGAACVLITPSPSLAALHWAGDRLQRPSRLAEREGWPIVDVVDMDEIEPWVTSMLSSRLIRQLRDADRRVICVHNTPGRSRRMACRSCRAIVACERCEAAVEEWTEGTLSCRRCGDERPKVCQQCGSAALANLRPGIKRLREELAAAAGRDVVEISAADAEGEPPEAGVYVGTEAVLHRVRRADTVAFLDFDAELLAPRYRAAEQAMGMLVRAARLVGPRGEGGRLVVQTRLPRHPVVDAALYADPGRLAATERETRRSLGFPPFGALASVAGAGAAEWLALSGLVTAPVDDRVLVRAVDWTKLADGLATAPRPAGSRLRVVVDPPRE
jgi:primosomal protein N' (replication factor Y) (superfamily II helicase)